MYTSSEPILEGNVPRPRPPERTWALITTSFSGWPGLFIMVVKICSASSGVLATKPLGVAILCWFMISIEMYSCTRRCRILPMAGVATRPARRANDVAAYEFISSVENLRDIVAKRR